MNLIIALLVSSLMYFCSKLVMQNNYYITLWYLCRFIIILIFTNLQNNKEIDG